MTYQTFVDTWSLGIVQFFQYVEPGFDVTRVVIKIPSTWEGLMACRTLEEGGVRTLATTLFSMPQAQLAAEVGCTYVAPYVNELKVHFEEGLVTATWTLIVTDAEDIYRIVDKEPLIDLCVDIQRYYQSIFARTKVLPASLTSIDQVFALAGVDHITIAPHLLAYLAQPAPPKIQSKFNSAPMVPVYEPRMKYLHNYAQYQIEFGRDRNGAGQRKLTEV